MQLKAKIVPFRKSSIKLAAEIVRKGGVVAYPTDTVYGLGCDPFNKASVQRLFEVKDRATKPVPILCRDQVAVEKLVELNETALQLAQRYWPGALTIVAPLKVRVPVFVDQGSGWLGVRVPSGRECLALIGAVGGYLTGTSANLSGKPSCRTADEVSASLGDRIDLILDGGRLDVPESTVVRVSGKDVEVLRRGRIGLESGRGRKND